jgi:DNA-binding PadR family transcriptional regulator
VIYKLTREGLVRRTSTAFRSEYELTEKGKAELAKAHELLSRVERQIREDSQ